MKKHIFAGLVALAIFPIVSFAQATDVDTSGTSSCAVISVNLRYLSRDSSTGGAVSVLQDFLNSKGYLSSQPTGFFGSMTRTAVIAFQTANGISATPPGFVGQTTRAKIQEIDCGTTTGTAVAPVSGSVSASGTTSPLSSSTSDLQAYLSRLLAQVAALQAQVPVQQSNTSVVAPTATIDQSSLSVELGDYPTFTGTANGTNSVQIRVFSSTNETLYSETVNVINGRWSFRAGSERASRQGNYTVQIVGTSDNVVLAKAVYSQNALSTNCPTYNSKPVITSITPPSGTVGTTIEINGCNFLGYEGDKILWFTNSAGKKGVFHGESDPATRASNTLTRVTIPKTLCEDDTSYSGIECPVRMELTQGDYTIYSSSYGGNSNAMNFFVRAQ